MRKAKTISQRGIGISLSADGLQAKQSVRTTFRLPDHTIKLLNVVAFQLGLKQKSLFDQLVEDERILKEVTAKALKEEVQFDTGERRQKTYVLNRRSLEIIEMLSREKKIPRDFLVEIAIQRLLPVFNSEQAKHKLRSTIYKDMKRHLNQGKKLFEKAEHLLGEDDTICEMIKKSNEINEKNVTEMRRLIEKGKAMEDFEGIQFQLSDHQD